MIKIITSNDKAKELVRILEKERKKFNRTICEHNNTITNECSDCNEQELFDDILEHTLTGIMDLLTDTHNVVPDIIDDYQKHGGMQTDDIKIKVEQEIYRRLNNMKGN